MPPTQNPEHLPQTVQEFGFVRHENGPAFKPEDANLLPCFRGLVNGELPTQLLETDQGNEVLLTSLIGVHKGLKDIAHKIEPHSSSDQPPEYGDALQGLLLGGLKSVVDNAGRGVKSITGLSPTVFYNGNTKVSNGRLLRVYFTNIGQAEGRPVYAKVAACRTKEQQAKVYRILYPTKRSKM
jgi:hypothetical protein